MNPTSSTNHCGYNDYGIRVSVIFPLEDGWAVAGVRTGWTEGSPLRKFATVEAAKEYLVNFKLGATRVLWKVEVID